MQVFFAWELSLFSLLGFMAIPFLYFGYRAKYYYRADIIKRLDFLLAVFSIVLAACILLHLANPGSFPTHDRREEFLLGFLHLAPLILALLILNQGRGGFAKSKKGENYSDYNPIPLNKEVERLGWDNLIVDFGLKEELASVIELLGTPKTATKYGIEVPKGILLAGPPGTGKTTIAKVMANQAKLSFFALKLDEVVSKWVGESEKNLSKLFKAASKHAPSVIFIDEVDSIGSARGGGDGQKWAENLLNHLLQLVDGVIKAEGLYIIAATNRPDLVDPALKRAGRLNRVIDIPLPDTQARKKLFQLYLSKLALAETVDLDALASLTENKSCADIKEICNQAGLNAFKRESGGKTREYVVTNHDIAQALHDFGALAVGY